MSQDHRITREQARDLNGNMGAAPHKAGDLAQLIIVRANEDGSKDGWLFGERSMVYVYNVQEYDPERDDEPEPTAGAGGIRTRQRPEPGQDVTAQAGTAEVSMDAPDAG